MRKIFTTVLLTLAVLFGKSQVILNEIYVDPGTGKQEFFELYNTSVNPQPVDLDCYTLITLFEQSNRLGVYVLDLPNLSINAKSYFVGAAANPFNVQGKSNQPAAFSWNNFGSLPTGSLKGYLSNSNNTGYTSVTIPSDFNELFAKMTGNSSASGGVVYGVFLFNNGTYVNGFLGGYGSASVPQKIRSLPSLTVTPNSACTPFTINWNNVTTAEFSGETPGNDNGYARKNDGRCGTWDKTASQLTHTPNATNGSATATTTSTLTTTQGYPCGNQVIFNISGATSLDVLPVEVHLYYDKTPIGSLDASDVYQSTITVSTLTEGQKSFTIPTEFVNHPVLLVYETKVGCYDKIVSLSPQSTGTFTTTQKNICNQQIDFTITGATGDASSYSLPIQVQLYDVSSGTPGTLISTTTVNNFSTTIHTILIPAEYKDKQVALVYKAAYDCFTKSESLTSVTGNLTTTQTSMCGKRIDFSITGASNTDVASYILNKDVLVQLLVDGTPIGSSQTINFSSYPYSGSIVVPDGSSPIGSASKVELIYTPFFTCFATTATATYTTPTITLSGDISCPTSVAGKSTLSFTIQSVSDPLAYPIKLWYVEDNGTTGEGDDITVEYPDNITGLPSSAFIAELQNLKSNVTLYAQSVQTGCATGNSIVPNNCTVLPVHFQSFNAARNKDKKEQVLLKWVTATEQNNRGFNVQKKVNGQWKNIAFVFSQAENGNSNTSLTYEYKDANVSNTVTQYQIQQVDYDGKTSYSDIKTVVGMEQKKTVLTYPNPGVDGKVNLLFSEIGGVKEVIVSDMNGRIVKQYRQVTENNLTIEGLKSGFYTIKITDRTTAITTVEKVIIR